MPLRLATLFALTILLGTTSLPAQKKRIKEEEKPWWDAPQPRFSKSELGQVFSGTIDLRGDVPVKPRTTYKAIAIKLGAEERLGTALFDTELLRLSAAIPERAVMFNTYRDGLGGAGHWVGDPYLTVDEVAPGWASTKGSFDDPRQDKAGPLPRDWGRYLGHYRDGEFITFAYEVHGTRILEQPGLADDGILARRFEVAPSDTPLHARLGLSKLNKDTRCEAACLLRQGEATLREEKGHWFLDLPPSDQPRVFTILMGPVAPKQLAKLTDKLSRKNPEPPSAFLAGGPARFPEPYITQGELGNDEKSYTVDSLLPPSDNKEEILFRFAGHDFFTNGDIAACTIDGDVWRVSGVDADLDELKWRRFATGLFQPLGLKIVDDQVHVLGRDQITRLHDLNDDGEADFYECFNNGCKIGKHVHEYAIGLETDPQGNFYYVKGHGAKNNHAGTLLKVSKDGSEHSVVATGFRWPNGSGVGPNGELTVADQEGTWVPSSRLDLVKPGGFYGFMNAHHRDTPPTSYDGPLCWIPHSVDNSCGGQTWVPDQRWGPYQGHMIHLSYGKCAAFVVLQEQVNGVDQAGLVKLPVAFRSGAMRGRFNPHDGQLYATGLRGWQTSAPHDGCLQRVRYTGKPVLLPTALHVHKNGIRVTFAQQLDPELAEDITSWNLEQWIYKWTKTYGSKQYKPSAPDTVGHDKVPVKSATLLKGGKEVFLEIDNLGPVMQMQIAYDLESTEGTELIGKIHHTIHELAEPLLK